MTTKINGSSVTLADLVINARNAGQKAFTAEDILAQQSIKLEEFAASGFDRADFPTWETSFNAEMEMLGVFSKQDSPATSAAKKAAATATQPAA